LARLLEVQPAFTASLYERTLAALTGRPEIIAPLGVAMREAGIPS
jgi:hypothetical protein